MTNQIIEPEFQVSLNPEILQREIIITNQDEFLQAGDILKLCKNKIKEVEEERKSYTDPFEQAKKRLIAKAKIIIEPIEAYIEKINKAMSSYHEVQEKIRLAELKKIEEEKMKYLEECSKKTVMPEPEKMMIKPETENTKTTRGNVATTSMIEKWEFEVTQEELLPREFLMPNEVAIRKAVNGGGAREIPGVKIYKTYKPKSF
jgi:hypothetical protein